MQPGASKWVWRALIVLTAILAGAFSESPSYAQRLEPRISIPVRPRPKPASRAESLPSIRVDVRLTLIPVTATNPAGGSVTGLPAGSFRLFEEGVEQKIKYFSSQDAPASIAVVFDTSASMTWKLDKAREAVARFLHLSNPGDEFLLVTFSGQAQMLTRFESSGEMLEQRLSGVRADGWTALNDAIRLAVLAMKEAKNERKALFVLTDGADNHSRHSEGEVRNLVREANASIYALGLLGRGVSRKSLKNLAQWAEETGGEMLALDRLDDLPDAAEKVSLSIRNQYLLGYSSDRPDDGRYHRVEVKLLPTAGFPPLRASWRTGYYAPSAALREP